MKDLITIQCPVCGTHYLPSEIYIPDSFFGKQKEVIRNPDGTINFYIGEDADYTEKFVCETCGAKLNIEAIPTFNVTVDNREEDYDSDYESVIDKPKKIKLNEVDIFND